MSQPFVIGIDGGGTQSQGVAWNLAGQCLSEARGQGLNLNTIPETQFSENLCEILDAVGRGLEREDCRHVVVGTASLFGEASEREVEQFTRLLRDFDAQRFTWVGDVVTALWGATGGEPGTLVIAGTGSLAARMDSSGEVSFSGGLGPLVGSDPGSALWLGAELLRLAQQELLEARSLGPLGKRICQEFDVATLPEVVGRLYQDDVGAKRLARLAGVLASDPDWSEDARWTALEEECGARLAELVSPLLRAPALARDGVFVTGSVLTINARVRAALERNLRAAVGCEVTLQKPRLNAAEGACVMALEQCERGLGRQVLRQRMEENV